MSTGFQSCLSKDLEDFIAFKRLMGFKYKTEESYLRSFDYYCLENDYESLTQEAVEGWVISRKKNVPSPYGSWMSAIRSFGVFVRSNGNLDAYVLSDRFRTKNFRPMPYLLTEKEIDAFFSAIVLIKTRRQEEIRLTLTAFFQIMYACGLRTIEARLLKCSTVDMKNHAISICNSKGLYDRYLPITSELAEFLGDYDERISYYHPKRQAFFPSPLTSGFLSSACVCKRFNQIWDEAGLTRPTSGRQPSPYAFRHNFAFSNIHRWAKTGHDVGSLIPYLMRYMGHTSLDSTYYYVHITPDFIVDYPHLVGNTEALLPEVDTYV